MSCTQGPNDAIHLWGDTVARVENLFISEAGGVAGRQLRAHRADRDGGPVAPRAKMRRRRAGVGGERCK